MSNSAIEQILGSESEYLLNHESKTISKESLNLPGPDHIDRVWGISNRSPQVLRSLNQLMNNGRLAGTGYVSILPVDQGIEHSAGASFAPNPAYFDPENSNYGTAIVGTIDPSDNSISYGTPVVFNSARTDHFAATYDPTNNKVVIAYGDRGTIPQGYGTAIVGTVAGTSISFGSEVIFCTGETQQTAITFNSSNTCVITYRNEGNSNYGEGIVGTVSSTSISFGTASVFNSASTNI